MGYNCIDKGTEKCPCILMETGQCYICGMIREGKCDCTENWQGVCPYTEYFQRNKTSVETVKTRMFKISRIKSYSPTLSVITLKVPLGYSLKCQRLGAYIMLGWKDWFIPISVLECRADYANQQGYLDLAVNATGPKTIGLLKNALMGEKIKVKGPFFSGVQNEEKFNPNEKSIILAKGIALMPLINIRKSIAGNILSFKLDTAKLPKGFLERYLGNMDYQMVDFEDELYEIAEDIREEFGYCYDSDKKKPNMIFMVSPHYKEKLLELTAFREENIIYPNHSNICCGEGICGSCTFTDENGITVKRCKCVD